MIRHPRVTMPSKSGSRAAFTLIEIMVVLAALSVLMVILASALWSLQRIYRSAAVTFGILQAEAALVDRFRDDVTEAQDAPEFAADFQASPVCMILRGDGGAIVMYRTLANSVERVVLGGGDPEIQSFPIATGERVEFDRRGRLLTLTLHGPRRGRLTASSALGGFGR